MATEKECSWIGECVADAAKQGAVDAASGVVNATEGAKDVAESAQGFAAFWTDPFGNTFAALQQAAHSLAKDVLPALTHATLPDLSLDWWVSSYAVAFGLAIFVMVILLFPGILAVARGRAPGSELFEQFTVYVPLFLGGAIFGPPLGIFLVKFFGALTDAVASWGITASADTVTKQMTRMLDDGDASGLAGGAVMGILLMLFMILGLFLVVLMLVVQLVTLYFTGILFPLAWVWIINRRTRPFGYKIAFVWLGILASHPLMFFLLGVAYKMIAAQTSVFEGVPSLARLVTLVVSILALLVAGTAPFTLFRLAPVMPFGANANGPQTSGSGGTIGDSDLSQTSRRNQIESTDAGAEESRTSPRVASDERASAGTAPASGPTMAGATSAPDASATGATSTSQAAGRQQAAMGAEAPAGGRAGSAAGKSASAGATKGATASSGAGASSGTAAAAEAGTAAEVGGAAAVGATGVGAAAIAAGWAIKTGYDKTVEASQGAVDMTAADVDGYDGNGVMEDR